MLTNEQLYQVSWKDLTSLCLEHPNLKSELFEKSLNKSYSLNLFNIAVAGSAGKTSVKEMITAVLQIWDQKSYITNPENHNTRIALATQILRLKSQPDLGVFEIGAWRVGDFKFPLQLLNPKVVLLLNVGLAHVGEFGSVENLINEKLSVLRPNGLEMAIVNGDDGRILQAAIESKNQWVSFGYNNHNHVQIVEENESEILYRIGKKNIVFNVSFSPPSFSLNLAAVLALADYLKIPFSAVQEALLNFHGVKRRFESFMQKNNHVIDDAFNASPESMYLGLKKVSEIGSGKKMLLILGSMKELGSQSVEQHRKLAKHLHTFFDEPIKNDKLGLVFVGEETLDTFAELKRLTGSTSAMWVYFENALAAKTHLEDIRSGFELIYLKGSKSTQLEVLIA